MLKVFQVVVGDKFIYEIYDGTTKLVTVHDWNEVVALWAYFRRHDPSLPEEINLIEAKDRLDYDDSQYLNS